MSCQLPEQTASYGFCLNDDVIMEGVPVIILTKGFQNIIESTNCEVDKQQTYQPNTYKNLPVQSFEQYYQLLLK
jgi:hypothetical protein|tara:strand:- start:362 stop:583 length:222 start_codon:yes stop_codon:yes gene_type:complete